MHEYSIYDEHGAPVKRLGVYVRLGFVASGMAAAFHALALAAWKAAFGPTNVPELVTLGINSVGTMGVFGLLVAATDRWAWRQWFLRPLFAGAESQAPPVVHGVFTGEVNPIRRDSQTGVPDETWRARVRIEQRWQHIGLVFKLSTDTWSAESHSTMARLQLESTPNEVKLLHTYEHKRDPARTDDPALQSEMIEGASWLAFSRSGELWTVKGKYFSEDGRRGIIELKQEAG
jgi:hypothetical protein